MKKRIYYLGFFLALIFLVVPSILGLGISPAIINENFSPGMELDYNFKIYSNDKVEVFVSGEFSDLAKLDKTKIHGTGSVNLKIKLPENIEKPGEHVISFGAKEVSDEEATIGSAIVIYAPIKIFVPYPGKYAEINFNIDNANIGENLNLKVDVFSKGKEPIFALTDVEIYDIENKLVSEVNLGSREILNQESYSFKGYLNTSGYKPMNYKAIAIVDYQQGIAKEEKNFRLGHLFVNITDYTDKIIKGGIKPFEISVESLWGNPIESTYSQVFVFRNKSNVTDFLTPTYSLEPWEKRNITGYINTDNLEIGAYETRIELNYGNKTIIEGDLNIVEEEKTDYNLIILGGIVLIILVIIIIWILYIKRKK